MKQTIDGRKVQNWHRPLGAEELRTRYRRQRFDGTRHDDRDSSGLVEPELVDPWDPMADPCHDGFPPDPEDRAGPYGDLQDYLFGNALQGALIAVRPGLQTWTDITAADAMRETRAAEYVGWLLPELDHWIVTGEFSDALSAAIRDSAHSPEELAVVRECADRWPSNALGEKLVLFSPFWTRSPLSFPGGTPDELVNHLFVRYPVPACLHDAWKASVWRHDGLTWMMWFVLFGIGGSVRRASRSLGFAIPRGFVEQWFSTPGDMEPASAAMYAEVRRLGGEAVEFDRLVRHRSFVLNPLDTMQGRDARLIEYGKFWQGTLRWMIACRDDISDADCPDILRWALHMHTEAVRAATSFSLKGRSPQAVIERSIEYRDSIHAPRLPTTNARWAPRNWDWDVETADDTAWSFRELTTSVALWEEGRAMHHCVGSYVDRCVQGLSTIVSVRCGLERRLTLEISPRTRQIVQVRGAGNRPALPEERAVLDAWVASVLVFDQQ